MHAIVVDPNGGWPWRDEDEFGTAVALGLFTKHDALQIRAETERVIANLPIVLPTG